MLAILYNTSSSKYRIFNRIYLSKTVRKYRSRNTFQRYSDTTVPHFTFFHQHPLSKKSLTHSNTALPVSQLPLPSPTTPTPFSRFSVPASSIPHLANQQTPSRLGSYFPILRISGFLAAQILHKIRYIRSAYAVCCV